LENSVDTITVLRSGKERSLVKATHDGIDGGDSTLFDNGTNIGIGNNNPQTPLHI
jgi:hypothetical protein